MLFCTSTLIEGVNTAAKSVLIYDKKINRADFDFFTFSNIRGRAGRLGQHHVGKVFVFNDPPGQEATEVTPTLFADNDDAPDDYVVHLDEQSRAVDNRISALQEALNLDRAGLRLAAAIGLDVAARIKSAVATALSQGALLQWVGRPTYDEIFAVVTLICEVRSAQEFGAFSAKQLTFFVNRLRQSLTMKGFLLDYGVTYRGQDASKDNVFKFLRACEYGLPQYFSVVELFVKGSGHRADYSLFVSEMSRWFRAEELKNLDEEGVPIQISERFYTGGDSMAHLVRKLAAAASSGEPSLSSFERDWVVEALDVATS